jgi:calcineurin-like phosphoesterase family protein
VSKQANVFYTSDLHIGHRLVAGKRGFWDEDNVAAGDWEALAHAEEDVEAHDDAIAANWDRVVKPQDTVYVLGDVAMNFNQHVYEWIKARPGHKHLIAGNHDAVHPQHRTAQKAMAFWMLAFDSVQPFARRKLEGISFLMSHYPYMSWGDGPGRGPARDEQYRLPDLGTPLLHGHTHGKERDHDNMFHVGLDAWDLELVPQSVIQDWLNRRKTP